MPIDIEISNIDAEIAKLRNAPTKGARPKHDIVNEWDWRRTRTDRRVGSKKALKIF